MNSLSKYFLTGLMTLLPFGLTIYIFVVFIIWSEDLSKKALGRIMGDIYIPGLGMLLALLSIVFLGFIISQPLLKKMLSVLELPFKNVPLVRSIYSASKNLSDFFSPKEPGMEQKVVMVKYPGTEVEVLGFLTRDDLKSAGLEIEKTYKVAVYFPLSYQIGGYTCFIPKSWIRELDMSVESAMGQSLTAWMPSKSSRKN